jgi:hypothetical protein
VPPLVFITSNMVYMPAHLSRGHARGRGKIAPPRVISRLRTPALYEPIEMIESALGPFLVAIQELARR